MTIPEPKVRPPMHWRKIPKGSIFYTKDFKPLPIEGIFEGAPCFCVMSGPSVSDCDLELLRQRGCYVMGTNNSPTQWTGYNLFTYVDRPFKFHDSIWRDPRIMKSVPVQHIYSMPLRTKIDGKFYYLTIDGEIAAPYHMPNVIGHVRNAHLHLSKKFLTEKSINWGNCRNSMKRNKFPHSLNCFYAMLKHAYSLGFREVYLVGCDFHMDPVMPYAFAQGKDERGCRGSNKSFRVVNESMHALRPHFEEMGFFVWNTTERSGLTAFDRLPYEKAVARAAGAVPQDPLDTADWYALKGEVET